MCLFGKVKKGLNDFIAYKNKMANFDQFKKFKGKDDPIKGYRKGIRTTLDASFQMRETLLDEFGLTFEYHP